MSRREVVYASAGFGKTFRISSRIIELLATGQDPRSILASTFTRKAAGEILDRVLCRLAHASLDAQKAEALGTEVFGQAPPDGSAQTTAEWSDVLDRVVRDLQRFEVSTLDAFFARVVRVFGNDLGLIPGWTVADVPTGDRMRREALEVLFERQDPGVLLELVRALHPGQVRRSIHEHLSRDIDALVSASRDLAEGAPGWAAIESALPPLPEDVADASRRIAEQLRTTDVPLTKAGKPNSRWVKAVADAAEAVREQDWKGLIAKGLGRALVHDEDPLFYSTPFPVDLVVLLEQALDLARAVEGRRLAKRAEALGRLASYFDATYGERMREAGALRFDDVTRLMATWMEQVEADGESTEQGSGSDLFVRLGHEIRNVLLDEFQDTSLPQWHALRPFLSRVLKASDEATAVVVADPKQSIYGWRGAAPSVVEGAQQKLGLERDDLPVSWRSSPPVLDVVNQVFVDLPTREVLQEKPEDVDTAVEWMDAFIPHESASPLIGMPGRVRLIAGPELIGTKNDQPGFMRSVAEHVAGLVEEAPGLSVGVLTRLNRSVGRILLELRKLGVPASQEGGTALGDSPAVAAVFALLQLADHPGDRLAAYHIANSPLGGFLGFTSTGPIQAAGLSSRVRDELVEDGYGPWLAGLAARMKGACDARERERLWHLVNLGYRWDRSSRAGSLRVTEFLARAMAESVQSSSEDRVRVMTIHQSKGLEFDLLVLAELHGTSLTAGRGSGGPIVYRPQPTARATHIYPALAKDDVALFKNAQPLVAGARQARAAAIRDSLSMLYVAMTRARFGLDMIVPADPSDDSGSNPSSARTHARLVREALGVDADHHRITEGETVWQHPATRVPAGWWKSLKVDAPVRPAPNTGPIPSVSLSTEGPRRRQRDRTSPSSKEGGGKVDVRFKLGLTDLDGRARAKGTLVHAWMEEVSWLDDGLPADEVLLWIAARMTPELPEETVREYIAWTREKVDAPEVQAAMAKASAPPESEPKAEVAILVSDGDDALMRGFIDRLVLTREEGVITQARILDFKTDAIAADDEAALQERVDYYRPQMQAYREAVRLQFGVASEQISAALIFLEVGKVCEV